jgi:hypothetical protein
MRGGLAGALEIAAHRARCRLARCHARLNEVNEARAQILLTAAALRREVAAQSAMTGLTCAFVTAFGWRQAVAAHGLRSRRSQVIEEGTRAARELRRWAACRRGLERRRHRAGHTVRQT